MLIIRENGISLHFDISDQNHLYLYGITQGEDPVSLPTEREKIHYTALEIKTTGANTLGSRLGDKSVGCLCPELPKYVSHEAKEASLGKQYVFHLKTSLLSIRLNYLFVRNCKVLRSWVEVTNRSTEKVGLEYVSSFALTGLADATSHALDQDCRLMIPCNGWCREFNWIDRTLGELGFHRNQTHSTNRIAISNTGTWSTKNALPMGCFSIPSRKSALLWQIESNTCWCWELGDVGSLLYLRLGGPNENDNGWWKCLHPNQTFESAKAAVAFGTDFGSALTEMTAYRRLIARRADSDKGHPVIFNDYMKCLNANPTKEKLLPLIDAAAAAGCEIFCIDAGWYADGRGWWDTIGAYEESRQRFPDGFKEIFDRIRQKGMRPGLWVEPENIGISSEKLSDFEDDAFFVRHGRKVIERGRYQFDMRNETVRTHLTAIIDRLVSDYGIEYFKFDYNIDAKAGTELHADSPGDALYENGLAVVKWIDEIQAKYPHLIIENCSSGGLRADYMQLQHYSVQSLTDAWENRFIVQIAAAAPTGVLPEQACVWCLPRVDFSDKEISSTIVNAMFRRIHLSAETALLNESQKAILHEGIQTYKKTRHLIDQLFPFYPLGVPSAASDQTLHCVGFKNEDHCFITVTNMGNKGEFSIPLPFTPSKAEILYPTSIPCQCIVRERELLVTLDERQAVVVCLN